MATFGKIVTKDELQPPARAVIYESPLVAEKQPLTTADIAVQSAVAAVDDAHNMWIDAWNGQAPAHVTDDLWQKYQHMWMAAQEALARNWYNPATG